MRVVLPPAYVGTRLVRVVSPVPSLFEVEQWAGDWWEPSTVTISEASSAKPATEEQLDAARVPQADREAINDERRSVEALHTMFASPLHLSAGNQMLGLEKKPNGGRRRQDYKGSAKFGKRGTKGKRAEGSESAPSEQWSGPLRRASDPQIRTDGPTA